MPFVVEQKQQYQSGPLMEEGFNNAVLAEIKDLGMEAVNPTFLAANREKAKKEGRDPNSVAAEVHKCLFIYRKEDGTEANEKLTVSLNDKATMFKRVKALTGELPSSKFDLETLTGTPVVVQIEHGTSQRGNQYAKVVAVARDKSRTKSAVPAKAAQPAVKPNVHGVAIADNDLGF